MPFRLNRFALYAAVAAASVGLSAAAHAAEAIKIGVGGPFSGGAFSIGGGVGGGAGGGAGVKKEEKKKGGGVWGGRMKAIERDDEAKNERGVQIAQELINKEKVSAAVGYINTGVALAAQRFFQDARIPVMNNVATGSVITHQFDDQPENYIFRNSAHDSIQ